MMRQKRVGLLLLGAALSISIGFGWLVPVRQQGYADVPAETSCAFCIGVYPCFKGGCCCAFYYPGWCNCGASCWTCWCFGTDGGFSTLCPGGPAQY